MGARLDPKMIDPATLSATTLPRVIKAEEWALPERIRPQDLAPAGQFKFHKMSKRMVPQNTNSLAHADTVIFGRSLEPRDGDGCLHQMEVPMYQGRAGVNAKGERIPVYGHLPPA